MCCRVHCGLQATDIDVVNGKEYPHCRKHHEGFRDAIDRMVLSYERLRDT